MWCSLTIGASRSSKIEQPVRGQTGICRTVATVEVLVSPTNHCIGPIMTLREHVVLMQGSNHLFNLRNLSSQRLLLIVTLRKVDNDRSLDLQVRWY